MPSIDGKSTKIGVKIASTWATAVQAAANNGIAAELSWDDGGSEIFARQIGSGNHMATSATRADEKPTLTLTGDVGYRNNFDTLLAQFMGTSGAPTLGGAGEYTHTITFNTTLNAKYLTVAYQVSSAHALEFPTCATQSLSLKTTSIPGNLEYTAGLIANKIETATAVNTFANLNSATIPTETELAAAAFDDDFWINTQSGSTLASGDQLNITSWELALTRPQQIINEIKGSTGNSAPASQDLFEGTLTVTLKENVDLTYFTGAAAETIYKSRLQIEGSVITAAARHINVYLPGMQLIKYPKYDVTTPGVNPVTLTFKLVKPSANPSGMASTYPYFTILSGLSTSLLA